MIEYTFFTENNNKGALCMGTNNFSTVFSGWGDLIYCYSFQNPQKLIAKFRLKSIKK